MQLRVTVYRPSDHKMAGNSFEFRYFEHNADAECSFCKALVTHAAVRSTIFC